MKNKSGALEFDAVINNTDFKRQIDEIERRIRGLADNAVQETSKMDAGFKSLATGIGAAFTLQKAQQFVSDIIRVRGEFQQLDIALTTMLQSKTRANQLMGQLVDFAANTPFGLKEVAGATKQLLAYGSSVENITDELRMLGDLASGVSQPIGELVYLYGTLRTQGRAYAVDIRQFAGRGIPIYQELANVLKINKDEVAAYVEAGKVGFPEVQKALQNMTAAGSQFGGLMEAQSQSIPGQIERLGDAWDQMLNKIGTSMQPAIEGGIAGLSTLVEHYDEIGKVIGGIIITYGSYKAAVIAVNAMNKLNAVTTGEVATAEVVAARAKADNAISSANLAKSLAAELAAKSAAAQASLNEARATVSSAAAKKAAALESARSAAADIAAAEAKLASALAAQSSANAYTTSTAKEVLAKDISIARTELQIATENGLIARKNASAATAEFNAAKIGVETAAKTANTVSTAANTAANTANTAASVANVAATGSETAATASLTSWQQLRLVATRQLTAAQAMLNRTMLANPYVLLAAGLAFLAYQLITMEESASAADLAIQELNKSTEEASKRREELTNRTRDLIAVMKDETATRYEQKSAYEELQALYPGQLANMTKEEFLALKAEDAWKKLNVARENDSLEKRRQDYANLLKQIEEYQARIKSLNDSIAKGGRGGLIARPEVRQLEDAQKQLGKLYAAAAEVKGEIDAVTQAQKEEAEAERIAALPRAQQIEHWQQIKTEIESQISAIEGTSNAMSVVQGKTLDVDIAAKLVSQSVAGITSNVNQTAGAFGSLQSVIDGISLKNLKNQFKEVEGELNKLTGGSKVQDKSFWERQKNDGEADLHKLPTRGRTSEQEKEWKRLTGTIVEADKELKKYNTTASKTPKPKKIDIKLPTGSLAEIDRQIQKAQDTLSKIPAGQIERIQAMHDTLLRLTTQRAEAEKIVEFRTWDEKLNYKRQQYEEYAAAVGAINGEIFTGEDVIVSEVAKTKYADLLKEGESYYQFLKSQLAPLEEKMQSGNLTDVESGQFLTLNNALRTLKGESSPMELFKESLDKAKDASGTTAQYVAHLRDEIAALDNIPDSKKDDLYWAKKSELTQQYREGIRATAQELKNFLQQIKGSEQKRLEIQKHYAGLREQAQKEGKDTYLIDKAERKEMSEWALEANAAVQKLNETVYDIATRKGLKQYADDAKAAYESIKNDANATAQQIEAARIESREASNRLADFDTQQWQSWLSILGQAGNEFAEMEGTLGAIGQLLSGAVNSSGNLVQNLSKAVSGGQQSLSKEDKSSMIANGVSGGISLIAGIFSARKRRKEKERAQQLDLLQLQLDYNMALNEEMRLRTILSENVYFKDYAGRVQDAISSATDAVQKYNFALNAMMVLGKAVNGQKNKVDWGAVGGAAGAGASVGAAIGTSLGTVVLPIIGTAAGVVVGTVVGAVAGAVVGLVGMMKKADVFGPLLEQYPELINANGELNKSMAETLLASSQLEDQTKLLLQNALDAYEAIEEAQQQITDIVSELTGSMGGELRDALVEAFQDGTSAAEAFANTVEKTLNNALSNLIFSAVFSRAFDALQKDLEGSLWGSGRSFQEVFASFMSQSDELTKQFNEAMKAAQDAGKNFGFDLFDPTDAARANGLSGIGQSITEDTGSLLLGQANAMRMTMAVNNELVQDSIFNLIKIESNTRHLAEIHAILSRMERSSGADYYRASGITF